MKGMQQVHSDFPPPSGGARLGEDSLKFALVSGKKKGPAHSGHFPLARSRSHLLKANVTLGQGGSAEKWQPGHPIAFHTFFFFLTL